MIAVIGSIPFKDTICSIGNYGRFKFYALKSTENSNILEELTSLQSYTHIIIENIAMDDKLYDALCSYPAKKIIIAPELKPVDIVVKNFYAAGIHDVITTKNTDELNDKLIGIFIRDGADIAAQKIVQLIDTPILKNTLPATETENSKTIRPAKAFTIAVGGAGNRIGTTTQVFQFALYLKSYNKKVAVIDFNGCYSWLNNSIAKDIKVQNKEEYTVNGIPVHIGYEALYTAKNQYDYLIIDYGNMCKENSWLSYMEQDKKIVVCGYKPWEQENIFPIFEKDNGEIHYFFSFVDETEKDSILSAMLDSKDRTTLLPYTPNPWRYCGHDAIYSPLFVNNIQQNERASKRLLGKVLHNFLLRKGKT